MTKETIFKKASDDGKRHYWLAKVGNGYIVFKAIYQKGVTEAEYRGKLGKFSDEEEAKAFFNRLQ